MIERIEFLCCLIGNNVKHQSEVIVSRSWKLCNCWRNIEKLTIMGKRTYLHVHIHMYTYVSMNVLCRTCNYCTYSVGDNGIREVNKILIRNTVATKSSGQNIYNSVICYIADIKRLLMITIQGIRARVYMHIHVSSTVSYNERNSLYICRIPHCIRL